MVTFGPENEPPALLPFTLIPSTVDIYVQHPVAGRPEIQDTLNFKKIADNAVEISVLGDRMLIIEPAVRQRLGLPGPIAYHPEDLRALHLSRLNGDAESARVIYEQIRRRAFQGPPMTEEEEDNINKKTVARKTVSTGENN